jgi:hypothetical protein
LVSLFSVLGRVKYTNLSADNIFDVRWIWAGNMFLLIGGGSAVASNSIYAVVADVAPESRR